MSTAIKFLISRVLGNKQFIETLFSWLAYKTFQLLEKRLLKYKDGKLNKDKVDRLVVSINRLQEALNILKRLAGDTVNNQPDVASVEGWKAPKFSSSVSSHSTVSSGPNLETRNIGLNVLECWSRTDKTPSEYDKKRFK